MEQTEACRGGDAGAAAVGMGVEGGHGWWWFMCGVGTSGSCRLSLCSGARGRQGRASRVRGPQSLTLVCSWNRLRHSLLLRARVAGCGVRVVSHSTIHKGSNNSRSFRVAMRRWSAYLPHRRRHSRTVPPIVGRVKARPARGCTPTVLIATVLEHMTAPMPHRAGLPTRQEDMHPLPPNPSQSPARPPPPPP